MNYKQLFPTYRGRFLFVKKFLENFSALVKPVNTLNLGCGEGDYDTMICNYTTHLDSCDLNANDIAFAKELNAGKNITYGVENAEQLTYPNNHFDLIVCIDVYEHVIHPDKMVAEMARILKPGGTVLITFPTRDYPFTYDPINSILKIFKTKLPMGAYSFGHSYLPNRAVFEKQATDNGFTIKEKHGLTHYLSAIPEIYWVGFLQHVFKDNSGNVSKAKQKSVKIRPTTKEPFLCFITDSIVKADNMLFKSSRKSVGTGYILTKQ